MKIAHIVNTIELNINHTSSYLDIAQPITIKSMIEAKYKTLGAQIDLFYVKHKDETISMPKEFIRCPDLIRYSYDLFKNLPNKRKLPLISDIINSLFQSTDADYFIYSNIDIGVFPDFYNFIISTISEKIDGFTINRCTMPKEIDGNIINDMNYHLLLNVNGSCHVGYDCFIFARSIVDKMKLGNIFIGVPPIGRVLHDSIRDLSERFCAFPSSVRKTFHLGDDLSWKNIHCPYYIQNVNEAQSLGVHYQIS